MSIYRAIGTFHSKKTALTTPPPEVPAPGGYADIVNGLTGGGPIAYWRRNSNGILLDASGNGRTMTVVPGAGSVTNVLPGLPDSSDEAMYFTGGAKATDAHEAAYDLAAFSVSFWLRPITLPGDGALANPFFAKQAVGLTEGNFVVYCPQESNGVLRARIRNAAGVAQDADAPAATLQAGVIRHICVRADNTGHQLWVEGQFLASSAGYTLAWTNNTAPIDIGTAEGFGGVADAQIDEIAVFNRYITDANIATLAQASVGGTVPVTVNDAFQVDESSATTLNIVANDTNFIGAKAALTLTIVDDSDVIANGHTVTVDGNNDIIFTAGAVTADEVVSFTYTIADTNGTSNVSTVQVTVTDTAAPPVIGNANCYPANGLDTVPVGTTAALQNAINTAAPGDHITLAAGNYNGNVTISCQGTQANPIVIKPAGATLSATAGGVWTFTNASRWTVVVGINLIGNGVRMSGDHNRVDLCKFSNLTAFTFVDFVTSRDGRVSRCEFTGFQGTNVKRHVIYLEPEGMDNGTNVRNRVDYCWMHDLVGSFDGAEMVATSRIDANTSLQIDVFTMDHCLITGWDVLNENELATIKFGGSTCRYCTFDNNAGYWNMRQSSFSKVISCWFEDHFRYNGNAAVNLKGPEHLVAGCRFVRSHCEVASGNFSTDDETPTQFQAREDTAPHPAALRCQVIHCVFDNCQLRVGPDDVYQGGFAPAEDNNTFGNTFINGATEPNLPRDVGTTHINPNLGVFDAAVKLTPADVGLNADDPYC